MKTFASTAFCQKALLFICTCLLIWPYGQAQTPSRKGKGGSKQSPKTTVPVAPPSATLTSPSDVRVSTPQPPPVPADISAGKLADDDDDENSPENLRKLEENNNAIFKTYGEAAYYRMDRNTMTVLPVVISIPGFKDNTDKGKAVYTRSQLYKQRAVKPVTGDIKVSSKYFYNKVKFATDKLFSRLLNDSTNFFTLTNLQPNGTGKEEKGKTVTGVSKKMTNLLEKKVNMPKRSLGERLNDNKFSEEEGPLERQIRDGLTTGNVATNSLKVWTSRPVLMQRIMFSIAEADKRTRIDPKKLAVWQNLLQKNYVLVLALLNPHEEVIRDSKGRETGTKKVTDAVVGFMYHIDTTGLDINNIRDQQKLRFVGRFVISDVGANPKSEEMAELFPRSSSSDLQERIRKLIAADMRPVAKQFLAEKSYLCAKNYYSYILSTGPKDTSAIRQTIAFCDSQLAMNKTPTADSTCLVNANGLFEEWVYSQSAANSTLLNFERQLPERFGVKSSILKTKPYIAAEIGRKEGLFNDQAFLVYRKELNIKTGQISEQRIGTLRVVAVGNNLAQFVDEGKSTRPSALSAVNNLLFNKSTKTKPKTTKQLAQEAERQKADSLLQFDLRTMSVFKQTDGLRLEPFDLVRQNEDFGFGLQVGYGTRLSSPAFVIGIDGRLGKLFPARLPSGWKIGFNIAVPINSAQVSRDWSIAKDKTTIFEIFTTRNLYLNRKFDVKPIVGTSNFNDSWHLLLGGGASLNIVGKRSNTKVRLEPQVGYVFGYTYQANLNLKFDF